MSTVSRSLNGSNLIPETTRSRIRGIAERLGFEFNAHARSLITRRVGSIGIILPPDFDRFGVNLYHGTLHNALRSVLEQNDLDLIVAFLTNHFTGGNNVRKLVSRQKVDGLILVQPAGDQELIAFLHAKEIPFVFSHYPPPPKCPEGVDVIYPDNELGGFLAGEHLAGIGRSRVLCIACRAEPPREREWDLRLAGVNRGLSVGKVSLRTKDILWGDGTMESGYNLIKGLGAGLAAYDGIVALNDLMAIGAILALRETGVRVPRDMAVVGYDDTDLASSMRPTLTTVHQPREELSLLTCQRLIELVKARHAVRGGGRVRRSPVSARRLLLPPRLVVRQTTEG